MGNNYCLSLFPHVPSWHQSHRLPLFPHHLLCRLLPLSFSPPQRSSKHHCIKTWWKKTAKVSLDPNFRPISTLLSSLEQRSFCLINNSHSSETALYSSLVISLLSAGMRLQSLGYFTNRPRHTELVNKALRVRLQDHGCSRDTSTRTMMYP